MNKPDLDGIYRKNPHLDRERLGAVLKRLREAGLVRKTRYRLAPFGTHRARIGTPYPSAAKPRRGRYYPGF